MKKIFFLIQEIICTGLARGWVVMLTAGGKEAQDARAWATVPLNLNTEMKKIFFLIQKIICTGLAGGWVVLLMAGVKERQDARA